MTEAPTPPRPDDGPADRLPPAELMSAPMFLQNGALASVEQAVELAVSLDHLRRSNPQLLTKLRLALVQSMPLEAEAADLATLHMMGLVTERGTPVVDASRVALALLRGPAGEETVDNPFLDRPTRALFDYLRHGTLVSVLYDRDELKAVHENDTVVGLMAAAPGASWVGYLHGRDKAARPGGDLPPSRN